MCVWVCVRVRTHMRGVRACCVCVSERERVREREREREIEHGWLVTH